MSATLLGPKQVRALLEKLGVAPTKKLGQNFVTDANTVRRIVELAGVTSADHVMEIGPGLGSLTLGLLDAAQRVTAVEIDGRLAAELPDTVAVFAPGTTLDVINADALAIDGVPGDPIRLVANLPYNVAVPALLRALETVPTLDSALVMVQREVGERMSAAPGSRIYGVPSVKLAWYGDWRIQSAISRQVFLPVPNVDSVLVGFSGRHEPGDDALRRATFAVVDAAFAQRRKMLRQSLRGLNGVAGGGVPDADALASVLSGAGVAETARAEELGIDDYVRIARSFDERLV